MFAAIMVDNDLLPASFWGLGVSAVTETMNNLTNSLCEDGNTPAYYFEGRSLDLRYQFRVGYGQPVVCTRVSKQQGPKLLGITRNEFGVCVGPGSSQNGAVWVYFPSRGTYALSLRYNVRKINLGSKKQMSLEEGKQYIPTMANDGTWHLVTRGDSGILGKQFALAYDEELDSKTTNDPTESSITSLDSSIATNNVMNSIDGLIQQKDVLEPEVFAEVYIDPETGFPVDEQGNSFVTASHRPRRSTVGTKPRRYIDACAADAYCAFVCMLFWVGLALTGDSIDIAPTAKSLLLAHAAVSHEEYLRQNPKWRKARIGPDKEDWLRADAEEREQQLTQQLGKDGPHMEELSGGKAAIPLGQACFPLKRVCKIKSNGKYKIRWVVLGNLEQMDEVCYAPTAGKKAVWLIFAVTIMKGLCMRFFDIKGAFMAERPTRDIYVTIDETYYILRYSLYGLKDAAKVFNEGLVGHLKAGEYIQSKWDQCLFYKLEKNGAFVYLIFHVDDFIGSGSSERMLDDFHAYMSTKYEITSNTDGIFLGIQMEQYKDGSAYIFRKPYQLQNIFDKYMPAGPTMSLPQDPMREEYSKKFDADDSQPCDVKEFRSMLGAVMQLTDCRPDIAFTIAKISQRQCSPRAKDKEALLFLLHYLWATRDKGLILRKGDTASATTMVRLRGYTDCSFACHGNGKSHYAIGFDLVDEATHNEESPFINSTNTGLFYVKSFMAPNVDLSSYQGETCSTVELAKDTIFYRGILSELNLTQIHPTPLYGDNDAARNLATHYDGSHKRVRYMLPKINWLMEQTKAEVIKMVRMSTDILPVDIATKNGRGTNFYQKRDRVMGY